MVTNKKKILVFGADGMIGHQMVLFFVKKGYKVYAHCRKKKKKHSLFGELEIEFHYSDIEQLNITDFLNSLQPDYLINALGVTIRRAKDISTSSIIYANSLFPHLLDDWASNNNAKLIHFSTDCVFSGLKGNYSDLEIPNATDLYGRTKGLGEVDSDHTLTLRCSMIGFELYNHTELLEWAIKSDHKTIKGFSNVIYSGITTLKMAQIVSFILENHSDMNGIYNISSGPISKFELLEKINDTFELKLGVLPTESKSSNKSLDASKFFKETNFAIPNWEAMLQELKQHKEINHRLYEN